MRTPSPPPLRTGASPCGLPCLLSHFTYRDLSSYSAGRHGTALADAKLRILKVGLNRARGRIFLRCSTGQAVGTVVFSDDPEYRAFHLFGL